jgi:hypothetical protein
MGCSGGDGHERRNGAGMALFLFALLVAVLTLPLTLAGCGERELPPLAGVEDEARIEYVPGLSGDQSRTLEEMGYPDHFFISIDPESSDRVERWIYFSHGRALDFDNGHLFGEEAIEDQAVEYPPTDLRPQDFDTLLTPEEASQLLGEPLYAHEVEDSLLPENTIMVYEKAVLLYRGGKLIGVDTQVSPPELDVP